LTDGSIRQPLGASVRPMGAFTSRWEHLKSFGSIQNPFGAFKIIGGHPNDGLQGSSFNVKIISMLCFWLFNDLNEFFRVIIAGWGVVTKLWQSQASCLCSWFGIISPLFDILSDG